jgi:hypothetical protein
MQMRLMALGAAVALVCGSFLETTPASAKFLVVDISAAKKSCTAACKAKYPHGTNREILFCTRDCEMKRAAKGSR